MIEFIPRLPQGYQEVEYIESSGTQYIDTGYKPTGENMRLVIDYMYSASPNGKSLFGAESSGTFPITFYSKSATTAEFYIGSTYEVVSYNITTGTRYKLDCHANNGAFTANLNKTTKSKTYSGSLLKTLNLFLFTNNGQQSTQLISARLYSCQIYDNEILVRDFVPCYRKADNVAGLYDLVNNVFYTNAGSGVFAVGADSNKHAIATITPGGVISFSAALRRRMMMSKIVKMVTLTLTGSFDNSGLFGERYVAVDGKIITELGTYKVRQGSTIILHTKMSPIMGGNEKYGIFVNNKCVRTAVNCINHGPDYEYTVTCNCTINGQGKVHERGGYARIDVTTEEPI